MVARVGEETLHVGLHDEFYANSRLVQPKRFADREKVPCCGDFLIAASWSIAVVFVVTKAMFRDEGTRLLE